jgi:hypothetical protein
MALREMPIEIPLEFINARAAAPLDAAPVRWR